MTVELTDERPALALAGIGHVYGAVPALDGVDLTVAPGELVALLGASGCGKSTLLRLIAGLERLQAGTIALGGRLVASPGLHVAPERRGVGLVFQDYALFPHLTVAENVGFGLAGLPRAVRSERVGSLLERVGLAAEARRYPHQISGGQRQRVALARALAPGPQLVLLDEPFSSLDASLRRRLREETLGLIRAAGAACVLVTHDADEALECADRIAVMRQGRIRQVATPCALYAAPVDPDTAALFGTVNRFGGTVRSRGCIELPFGCIHREDLPEGTEVEILLRPEAITLTEGAHGVVERVRRCGPYSLVGVDLPQGRPGSGTPRRVTARVPAGVMPTGPVGLSFDPAAALVFPRA